MSKRASAPPSMAMNPDKAARVEQERARILALFDGVSDNKTDFIRDAVQQVAWIISIC